MRRLPRPLLNAAMALSLVLAATVACRRASQRGSRTRAEPPRPPTPSRATATYDPRTFREDITRLVAANRYRDAVALVRAADVERQLRADGRGYVAVGWDTILLPGVDPQIEYDPARDWYVPGTQDAIQDAEWQAVATEFAHHYNLRRRRGK